jgi:hypothetical protein
MTEIGSTIQFITKLCIIININHRNQTTLSSNLPLIDPRHLQMHPLDRLRRDRPGDMNLLLGILHLEREPPHHAGDGTPQLRARKVLPDARALAMQEGDLGEVGRRAAGVVRSRLARLIGIDPSLRNEIIARRTPELGTAVDGIRAEDDAGALRDMLAGDGRVADGLADRRRDRRVQAQDFLADAVEQRHGLQVVPGDGGVAGGDAVADLGAETLLHVGVLAEEVAGPGEGAGGGFVL